ncbi:MAG: Holliday junction branch migration protein RuvA [Hyphomicrobiaceae bacterium]|nr:Holliday junction branch migration protein RuvA [Hyphomicrobiaceae bacterium]
MIGKLKGLVDDSGTDWAIIDVNGVGYEVHCSPRTLAALPSRGELVELHIETHVRETEFRLFAFTSKMEREWFRLLQTVQGVGAKVALAVLGTMSPHDLANAIAMRDKAAITKTPGVGPKVAQRLLIELKDKVPDLGPVGNAPLEVGAGPVEGAAASDAVSALTNLGYAPAQASDAILTASREAGEDATAKQLIRLGLKALAG